MLTNINEVSLFELYGQLQQSPVLAGFVTAPEKVQRQPPFKYLGYTLYHKEIIPQKLEIMRENGKLE